MSISLTFLKITIVVGCIETCDSQMNGSYFPLKFFHMMVSERIQRQVFHPFHWRSLSCSKSSDNHLCNNPFFHENQCSCHLKQFCGNFWFLFAASFRSGNMPFPPHGQKPTDILTKIGQRKALLN